MMFCISMLKEERGDKIYNKSCNAQESVKNSHIWQSTWHYNFLYEIWLIWTYLLIEKY